MKMNDAYIVWKERSADLLGGQPSASGLQLPGFTIPDGYHFHERIRFGRSDPPHGQKGRSFASSRTSPEKLVMGMLSLFRYIVVEGVRRCRGGALRLPGDR